MQSVPTIDDLAASVMAESERLARRAVVAELRNERLQEALENIAGFGDVNLAGEWEPALRDIIRSMTDCAKSALRESV